MRIFKLILLLFVITVANLELRSQTITGNEITQIPDTIKQMQITNEAVQYYVKLSEPMRDLKIAHYNYLKMVTKLRKARAVEKSRQQLLKVLQSNMEIFKNCDSFRDDSTLKMKLIEFLNLNYLVLKEDFDKIIDMEDVIAQSFDQAEAHQLAIDLAVEKINATFKVLRKAETDFFGKYHITANNEKDELTLKIEKANKALEYYNSIHRIFFKVNKQFAYTSDASAKKDIANLEQHTITLVSFAEDALSELKKKDGYDGDNELLATAIEIIQFYNKEGKQTYPANIEFYLKEDNMQKTIKKFNSIKESDRTKPVVDQFNNEVNIFNKAAGEVNKINQASFKKHNDLLEIWNKKMDQFFKKHS